MTNKLRLSADRWLGHRYSMMMWSVKQWSIHSQSFESIDRQKRRWHFTVFIKTETSNSHVAIRYPSWSQFSMSLGIRSNASSCIKFGLLPLSWLWSLIFSCQAIGSPHEAKSISCCAHSSDTNRCRSSIKCRHGISKAGANSIARYIQKFVWLRWYRDDGICPNVQWTYPTYHLSDWVSFKN